jgi:hypothetical protein
MIQHVQWQKKSFNINEFVELAQCTSGIFTCFNKGPRGHGTERTATDYTHSPTRIIGNKQ